MDKVDTCTLDVSKLWLYQHGVVAQLSWDLFVNDFNETFMNSITNLVSQYLKKWLKIPRCGNDGILFLPRKEKGLNLTRLSTFYKQMQVVKCSILKDS